MARPGQSKARTASQTNHALRFHRPVRRVGDITAWMPQWAGLIRSCHNADYRMVMLRGRPESGSAPLSVTITVSEAPTVQFPKLRSVAGK